MRHQWKRYVYAGGLVLALPVLALAAFLASSSGKNGIFHWFTVGAKEGAVVEHTIAYGVNDDGVIVGTYENDANGDEHGFVTKDKGEHISAINHPGACATEVTAINNEGVIAGIYEKGTTCDDTGFVKKGDDYKDVKLPATATFNATSTVCTNGGGTPTSPGKCTVTVSSPDIRGINDEGDIAGGFSSPCSDCFDYGFLLTEDGKFRVLEACTDPTISDLSKTPEGCASGTTDGWGLNEDGVVVGHYEDTNPAGCVLDDGVLECSNHHHGFMWTKKWGFKKLYCDGDALANTDANGINEEGVIVGACDSNAFVLLPPYRNVDWHTFTIPDPAAGKFRCPTATGWELNKTIAWGISDEGKIVGSYVCEHEVNIGEKSYAFEVELEDVLKAN